MSVNKSIPSSSISETSEGDRLFQNNTIGALAGPQQHVDQARLYARQIFRGTPKDCSSPNTIRRAASLTLSRITEIDEEWLTAPDQPVRSHSSVDHLPAVQSLRALRDKATPASLFSYSARPVTTIMTDAQDARELFEEYGIDRPPG